MNIKPIIILTVPHSKCRKRINNICNINVDRKNEMCDLVAECFANKLKNKLEKNFTVDIILSENNRADELDDNRFSYKKDDKIAKTIKTSNLWIKLKERILFHIKKPFISYKDIIVLDIHSFPLKSFDGNDIALLDNYDYQEITKNMYNYLKDKYKIKIYNSYIGNNSIIDVLTLHPLAIKAVLVEINESLSNNKMDNICNDIYNFIGTKKKICPD